MVTMQNNLQEFVSALAGRLKVDVATLYRLSHDRQSLRLAASHGLHETAVGYTMPVTQGITGRVARTGKVVSLKHPELDPDYHLVPGSGEEQFKTYFGIPIARDRVVRGVLVLQTREPHMYLMPDLSAIHETGLLIERALRAA